ncbi:MAG TPA: hypothetical protein VHE61_00115 [Opitutaceae bacterium]|nr:hypothetical protein [Opitutaceae bacterium]
MHTYREFIECVSKEVIAKNLITERKFEKLKQNYDAKRVIPAVESLLWSIDCQWSGRHVVIVVSDRAERLAVTPENNLSLKPFAVTPYEYLDGRWKMQDLTAIGDLAYLPFASRSAISDILIARKGLVAHHLIIADK